MREPAIGLLTSSFPWEEVLKAFLPPALELGDAAAPDAVRQHRRGGGASLLCHWGEPRAPPPSQAPRFQVGLLLLYVLL